MDEKILERYLKSLANRRRLAILRVLRSRKLASVGQIAEDIQLSLKATSKHLIIMYAVGIVEKEQQSLTVNYRLAASLVEPVRTTLSLL